MRKFFIYSMAIIWVWLASSKPIASDHFDGERFHNQSPTKTKTLFDLVKWRLTRSPQETWRNQHLALANKAPPATSPDNTITTTFINHATVLVQLPGVNVLTDPIWSQRASPLSFIGPKRYHQPGLSWEQLPNIDVVVISHNHYDHLDVPTLKQLYERFQPLFIVGLGNQHTLLTAGIAPGNIVELDWWHSYSLKPTVTIHAVPAQHWSTRTRFDINQALWAGFIIESSSLHVYFAGDTGYGDHFGEIARRFSDIELSLLPIGAYLPRYFMKDNHLSPDDAIKAHQTVLSKHSMAIHFGTFNLGDDGQFATPKRLMQLVSDYGLSDDDFFIPQVGQVKSFRY